MPLSVMRSVKSELLTPWKGQAACWEYLLRMFLTSKFLPSCSPPPVQETVLLNFMTLRVFWNKTVKMPHSATEPGFTLELKHNTNHTCKSTNSGNAKMLMPTFTRGCEVGLFKQWEVCKVKKEITHSQCASEVHTYVKQKKYTVTCQKTAWRASMLCLLTRKHLHYQACLPNWNTTYQL